MSLFNRAPKPDTPPPKTLFGAMSKRGERPATPAADVVVDKGKSFALFKKPAKPVEPLPSSVAPDVPFMSGDDDVAMTQTEPPVIDVTFVEHSKPVPPEKAAKSGFSLFSKGKSVASAAASAAAPTVESSLGTGEPAAAKPVRKGLFSRGAKPGVDSAAPPDKKQEAKKAKTPGGKKPRTGGAFSKPASEVFLYTELNEGTRLWWKLTLNSLERVEESEVPKALSFSTQDYRYAAHKKLQYGQANNLVLSESSEYCSLANASGGPFGAVHATPRERAAATSWRIQPGMLALDRLLASKLSDRKPTDDIKASDAIVGFNFEDPSNGSSLAVLYKLTGDHQLSNLQISVNAEDLGFVLSQFAQAARVNSEDAPVILFTAEELLAVAGSLDAFPHEAVWQGYSVRSMLTGALALSAIASVVGVGLAGTAYLEQASLNKTKAGLEQAIGENDSKSNEIVGSSVRSFAQKTSLDHTAIFAGAQNLWMPGAVVVMTADYPAGNTRYELRMKLPQGVPLSNRPSVAFALTPESLSRLVDYKAADGCIREGTYIAGSLNEVQIIVNCQVPVTPLSRYRLE